MTANVDNLFGHSSENRLSCLLWWSLPREHLFSVWNLGIIRRSCINLNQCSWFCDIPAEWSLSPNISENTEPIKNVTVYERFFKMHITCGVLLLAYSV